MLQQILELLLLSLSLSLYIVVFTVIDRDDLLRANVASLESSDVRYLTSGVQDRRLDPYVNVAMAGSPLSFSLFMCRL